MPGSIFTIAQRERQTSQEAQLQASEAAARAAQEAARTAAPLTVATSLADVSLGRPTGLTAQQFKSIDELVQARTDPALRLVREGSAEAQRLSQLARGEAVTPLEQFTGLEAFQEQAALLGLTGEEAQEQAIGAIPVSQFDAELQRRQRSTLLRQAAARGEVGAGATLSSAQQLAGGQQAENIQRRLAELEPLVAAARGTRATISGIEEAQAARLAQLQAGAGVQQANIRLGATAPIIESRLQQAELSGLGRIASATQQGQIQSQLAGLAGTFAPKIESFFNQPQIQGPPVSLANFSQFTPPTTTAPRTGLTLGR